MAAPRPRNHHLRAGLLLESRIDQLGDDVAHVLQLLTLCEPIDLDVLMELAGEQPVERAEDEGLIRIARDGRALTVRYAHPLFGEVIRKRLGFASSRRCGESSSPPCAPGRFARRRIVSGSPGWHLTVTPPPSRNCSPPPHGIR